MEEEDDRSIEREHELNWRLYNSLSQQLGIFPSLVLLRKKLPDEGGDIVVPGEVTDEELKKAGMLIYFPEVIKKIAPDDITRELRKLTSVFEIEAYFLTMPIPRSAWDADVVAGSAGDDLNFMCMTRRKGGPPVVQVTTFKEGRLEPIWISPLLPEDQREQVEAGFTRESAQQNFFDPDLVVLEPEKTEVIQKWKEISDRSNQALAEMTVEMLKDSVEEVFPGVTQSPEN